MNLKRLGGVAASLCLTAGSTIAGMSGVQLPQWISFPVLAGLAVLGIVGVAFSLFWPEQNLPPTNTAPRPGRGGNATIEGTGYAHGGKGGGLGGGDGGDAFVKGTGLAIGGEAGQSDRGGRSGLEVSGILPNVQLPDGSWLYDYGRGGNPRNFVAEPDTPLSHALAFVFYRHWAGDISHAQAANPGAIASLLTKVNTYAAQGRVRLWLPRPNGSLIQSPTERWAQHPVRLEELMDWDAKARALGKKWETEHPPIFASRREFEMHWPRYFDG